MPISDVTGADLDACLALSDEAGWNQTEADWRLFLHLGRVFGIRDAGGTLVATGAALPYQGFGFVSMVLVTAAMRRQGLATRLVNRAVEELQEKGLTPVLDATPEGALVYARQGFQPVFGFARWRRAGDNLPGTARQTGGIAHAVPRDARAAGTDRADLLADFAARPGSTVHLIPDGFGMARNGRRAAQVGPVVAASDADAITILSALFDRIRGAVFIDVPDRCTGTLDWLRRQGFTLARRFTRMALGRTRPFGHPERQFALAGPEFG